MTATWADPTTTWADTGWTWTGAEVAVADERRLTRLATTQPNMTAVRSPLITTNTPGGMR